MFKLQEISILTYSIIVAIKKCGTILQLIYQNSLIPTVNKLTKVTRKTSTIIDHILINSFVNTNFKTFISKIDISDHLLVCFLQPTSRPREEHEASYITKRVINKNAIEMFKQELYKTSQDDVINNKSSQKIEIAKLNLNIEMIRNFLSRLKNVQKELLFKPYT